jgi:NADPH:quinone reductase-like Zn-dependent oxidoreductase
MATGGEIGIGWGLAGVVDKIGSGVDRFVPGDAVIGMRDLLTAPVGAQDEQVVLDTDAVSRAPHSVSPAQASTLPLNGLTAMQVHRSHYAAPQFTTSGSEPTPRASPNSRHWLMPADSRRGSRRPSG